MKYFLFLILFPFLLSAQTYRIEGNIANLRDGEVYLMDTDTYSLIDTAQAQNGRFVFDGRFLDVIQSVALYQNKPFFSFLAENSNISVQGDVQMTDKLKVIGSSVQKDYEQYLAIFTEINQKYAGFFQAEQKRQMEFPAISYEAKDEDEYKLIAIQEEYMGKVQESLADFIRKNPNSYALGYLVHNYYRDATDFNKKEMLLNLIPADKRNDTYSLRFQDNIAEAKSWLQQPFVDFAMKTPEGRTVSLSDYKGKYVFVDFWASWCKPCRKENPKLLKIYNLYHSKGLEMLGVSLDKDATFWQNAIKNDNLVWTQISDLKMWESEAVQIYHFQYIPFNLLINPDGIIIAKNLRGKALEDMLKTVF